MRLFVREAIDKTIIGLMPNGVKALIELAEAAGEA